MRQDRRSHAAIESCAAGSRVRGGRWQPVGCRTAGRPPSGPCRRQAYLLAAERVVRRHVHCSSDCRRARCVPPPKAQSQAPQVPDAARYAPLRGPSLRSRKTPGRKPLRRRPDVTWHTALFVRSMCVDRLFGRALPRSGALPARTPTRPSNGPPFHPAPFLNGGMARAAAAT